MVHLVAGPQEAAAAEDHAPVALRFERRSYQRRPAKGDATAVRVAHDLAAYRHRVCSLSLRDMSEAGLGAVSDTPLQPDEPIVVHLSAHGAEPGFDLHGHVVRCSPAREEDAISGYDVAIRFDPFNAA